MIGTAQVESATSTKVVLAGDRAAMGVPAAGVVTLRDDVGRARELDHLAATIEGAAEGLAVFLLLALFGVVFVVAVLTGVLA